MPGTNAGTGQPISFQCSVGRREKDWRTGRGWREHTVHRTGRERYGGPSSIRMTSTAREYVCSCGHHGWSRHYELARYPLEET